MREQSAPIYALLILLTVVPAAAQVPERSTVAEDGLITRCIRQSARGKLLMEKTLRGLRDQEGGWIGAEVSNRDGSYDLGPMQVNSWWVPAFGRLLRRSDREVRRWLRDDACFNIEAARWIFLSAMARHGDYWWAIGAYHSPIRSRQLRYAVAVRRRIQAK